MTRLRIDVRVPPLGLKASRLSVPAVPRASGVGRAEQGGPAANRQAASIAIARAIRRAFMVV